MHRNACACALLQTEMMQKNVSKSKPISDFHDLGETAAIANDVFGSLGDTGPLAPKKVLKVSAELAGSVPWLGGLFEHIC